MPLPEPFTRTVPIRLYSYVLKTRMPHFPLLRHCWDTRYLLSTPQCLSPSLFHSTPTAVVVFRVHCYGIGIYRSFCPATVRPFRLSLCLHPLATSALATTQPTTGPTPRPTRSGFAVLTPPGFCHTYNYPHTKDWLNDLLPTLRRHPLKEECASESISRQSNSRNLILQKRAVYSITLSPLHTHDNVPCNRRISRSA